MTAARPPEWPPLATLDTDRCARLVIDCCGGGLLAAYPPDRAARATNHAQAVGGLVVLAPVAADYRPCSPPPEG